MLIILTGYASAHFKMLIINKVIVFIMRKYHFHSFHLFYKAYLLYVVVLLNLMVFLLSNPVLCVCVSVDTIVCVAFNSLSSQG